MSRRRPAAPTTSKYFDNHHHPNGVATRLETTADTDGSAAPFLRRNPRRIRAAAAAAMTTLAAAVSATRSSALPASPPRRPGKRKQPPVTVTPPTKTTTTSSSQKELCQTTVLLSGAGALSFNSPSSKKSSKTKQTPARRTESFSVLWAGSFPNDDSMRHVKPHTLILGSHPSITSLDRGEYYGHIMNAFWWIAGDCLGFRRASGISPSTQQPYQFTTALRYNTPILPYDDQIRCLVSHGFCLWDVVESCERPGSSLDQAIQKDVPNRIREFCQQQQQEDDGPCTIRRIVLANGGTSAAFFVKHFRDWLASGELVAGDNVESVKAFGRALKAPQTKIENAIQVICALGVSPAAARYTYQQKRDFWEEYVYRPGLADYERSRSESSSSGMESTK